MRNLVVFLSIVLLGWLFLVLWDAPADFFFQNKKTRVASLPTADSYMVNTDTVKFEADGTPAYLLKAERGYYYTREDRFELLTPTLTAKRSKQGETPWQLSAEMANSTQHGNRILLSGEVHAWQNNTGGKNEFYTRDLSYFPEQNIAKTDEAVKLLHPTSTTKGKGMVANFTDDIFRLLADVKGTYHAR